jgi:hypothetical protein
MLQEYGEKLMRRDRGTPVVHQPDPVAITVQDEPEIGAHAADLR